MTDYVLGGRNYHLYDFGSRANQISHKQRRRKENGGVYHRTPRNRNLRANPSSDNGVNHTFTEWSQGQCKADQRQRGRCSKSDVRDEADIRSQWNTYGIGRRVGTAGNVLLAALVDKVLEGHSDGNGDWR
jgi:hypothetical protein